MTATLRAPGWYRAGAFLLGGVLFAAALVTAIRLAYGLSTPFDGADGWDTQWQNAVLIVSLLAAPLFFLVGLGAFDYWFYWASGRPTRPEDHSSHGATSWRDYFRVNTDHKVIGIQYVVTSFFFMLVGGLLAMLVRAELAAPGSQFVDPNAYNGLFSVHASLMIFLFIIPVFAGLANYVLPLMIGAPDMAFPRLNALSFWMLPVGGAMMTASFFAPGGSFATGWTAYAPLSTSVPIGQLFFTIGVQFAGASSIATALNFLVTIITMRAPGMSFWRMPLLVWANFSTSLLVVIATPFVAASQFFVLLDYALGFNFFVPERAGDVLMYQHVFWFYSHPAVYIMMLPGFGIISEVLSVKSRKPIFGYRMMAFSLLAIVLLGFTVWAHHMFVSGMQSWIRIPMMVTTAIIAVPTGIKIFSWLATLWRGVLHLDTPMLFALGFITMFTLGGISGVMLAMLPITIHVSDTYFIVAHIHYVLYGGSLFTIFAGVYYWFPKMTGRMFDDRLGRLHFWLDVRLVQPDVRADARDRHPGHAAPRRRLPGAVRDLEPVHLARLVRARALDADLRLQHGQLVACRAARGGQPVARAHARVAGLLAAADLQLRPVCRPSSAGRTSTACPMRSTASSGRPARRPGHPAGRRGRGLEPGVSVPMADILVLANETIGGAELLDAIRERHAQGDARFHVVVPLTRPSTAT